MTVRRLDFPDLETASRAAAARIVALVGSTLETRERFTFALTGGTTPRRLYELLAGEVRDDATWNRVDWLWGDERCVAPDDEASNYRLAYETLLAPARAPGDRVHRIQGELRPPDLAATEYEALLETVVDDGMIDLVLLGMGDDGHVASLFPGHTALEEAARSVIAVEGPEHLAIRSRITLTMPVINRARAVFLLVAGDRKRAIADEIFAGREDAGKVYPAARVSAAGETFWFVG